MSEWETVEQADDGEWETVQAPRGMPYNGKMTAKDKALQLASQSARALGLAGRTIVNTATSLPLAAADFGVGARNLVTGERNPSATTMWNDSLDAMGLVKPETRIEKGADIAGQMLIGSKMPIPQARNTAPAAFNTMTPERILQLQAAQSAGFKIPPSTTNPTITNRLLESWGGKVGLEQDARLLNMAATKAAAQKTLGLHPNQPVTDDAIQAVVKEAGAPYKAISKLGEFDATKATLPAGVSVLEKISPLLMGKTKSVDAGELVRAWKQANADARGYFQAYARDANPETLAKAKANEGAARSIDEFIATNLEKLGKGKMLDELKEARRLIAKAYSVDDALVAPDVVSAAKLATQLSKGKPLSGDLKKAAEFAQSFPQVARPALDSGAVRNTDFILGGGAAAASGSPSFLMYPFSRMAARDFLMSDLGQRLAVPSTANLDPMRMGAGYGLLGSFSE